MNGWWMKIVTSDRWRQQKIWVRAVELRIVLRGGSWPQSYAGSGWLPGFQESK
jgi:hypothetical protein